MSTVIQIKESSSNDIRILELDGRLDSFSADELGDRVAKLIETGSTRFLFDLAPLTYISSAGLRVFLGTAKQLDNTKGKFALCSLRTEVKEIFDISGFTALFEIFPSREDALKSF